MKTYLHKLRVDEDSVGEKMNALHAKHTELTKRFTELTRLIADNCEEGVEIEQGVEIGELDADQIKCNIM
jgi:hypothetical protein